MFRHGFSCFQLREKYLRACSCICLRQCPSISASTHPSIFCLFPISSSAEICISQDRLCCAAVADIPCIWLLGSQSFSCLFVGDLGPLFHFMLLSDKTTSISRSGPGNKRWQSRCNSWRSTWIHWSRHAYFLVEQALAGDGTLQTTLTGPTVGHSELRVELRHIRTQGMAPV